LTALDSDDENGSVAITDRISEAIGIFLLKTETMRRLSSLRRNVAVFLACFSLFLGVSNGLSQPAGKETSNPLGRALYRSHCLRCHGEDGDATDYYNIIPLAGIGRRPPVGLVGRFRREAYSVRGVEFLGEQSKQLGRYLAELQGRKGLPDPGWLWSPYLLNRKSAFINACRILDVRRSEEYRSGHIPNALSLPSESGGSELRLSEQRMRELLRQAGIHPDTQIVIYDRNGGPEAAWLWWNLVEAGHAYVALLDGGWENWIRTGSPVLKTVPNIEIGGYQPLPSGKNTPVETAGSPDHEIEWDWKEALGPDGIKNGKELNEWFRRYGLQDTGRYRLQGGPKEAAYLAFLLKLLGRSGRIQDTSESYFTLEIDDVSSVRQK